MFKHLHLSLLAAAISLPCLAQTQEEEPLPRWYQIELVIFKHTEAETAENLIRNPFTEENSSLYADFTNINGLLNKHSNGKNLPPPVNEAATPNNLPTPLPVGETESEAETEIEQPAIVFLAAAKDELVLSEYALMLKNRRAYQVLWHGAWQQELESDGPVNQYTITAGKLIQEVLPAPTQKIFELEDTGIETEPENLLNNTTTTELISAEQQAYNNALERVAQSPKTHRELQGSLTVYKKNFAHLEFDIWFSEIDTLHAPIEVPHIIEHSEKQDAEEPAVPRVSALDFVEQTAPIDVETPTAPEFELVYEQAFKPLRYGNITEDRRLRPQELYYVDHPLFGAIVKMVEVPHPSLRTEIASEQDNTQGF